MANVATLLQDHQRQLSLEVLVRGDGEPVVLVPSAMRGAADFGELQKSLAIGGYRSVALNPRGAGRSTPPSDEATLRELADDVAFVIRSVTVGPAHLVGHALGNVVVRATASWYPDLVASVTVMPCGGHNLNLQPVPTEVLEAFSRCHDEGLPVDERLAALRTAFFAAGNDPTPWLEGWFPRAALSAPSAFGNPEVWWRAGRAPILILQPLEDAMAPVSVGMDAAEALGDRASYAEIPKCGHAILPEQPEFVAAKILGFLSCHRLTGASGPES